MATIPIIVVSHVYPTPPKNNFTDSSGSPLNFFLPRFVKNQGRQTGLKKGVKNGIITENNQKIFPVNGTGA
jgi:hypothetical protein